MDDPVIFSADHNGIYHNNVPFSPWIQESISPFFQESNVVFVRLPAHLNDDLNWTKEMELAQGIIDSGKKVFWEIDLGLSAFQFTPDDSATFYSFSVAVEEFTAAIWPIFQHHTFGVALYRGAFQPMHTFPLFRWEAVFADWIENLPNGASYELYCAGILAEYLHRLASFLPDSVLPFALIDISGSGSPAQVAQLFSKERFEYIHLALKGAQFPFQGLSWNEGYLDSSIKASASVGIYLPNDAVMDLTLLAGIDEIISNLNAEKVVFRIIAEEKLTEQWDGLDKLIVPKHVLSVQGGRKLQGFIAAGGAVEGV